MSLIRMFENAFNFVGQQAIGFSIMAIAGDTTHAELIELLLLFLAAKSASLRDFHNPQTVSTEIICHN